MAFVEGAHGGNETDSALIQEKFSPEVAQGAYIVEYVGLRREGCLVPQAMSSGEEATALANDGSFVAVI